MKILMNRVLDTVIVVKNQCPAFRLRDYEQKHDVADNPWPGTTHMTDRSCCNICHPNIKQNDTPVHMPVMLRAIFQ